MLRKAYACSASRAVWRVLSISFSSSENVFDSPCAVDVDHEVADAGPGPGAVVDAFFVAFPLVFIDNIPLSGSIVTVYDGTPNVDFELATAPAAGSVIRGIIYQATTQVHSIVELEELVGDGSTAQFTLTNAPFMQEPTRYRVLVEVGGQMLSAGYTQEFTVSRLYGTV